MNLSKSLALKTVDAKLVHIFRKEIKISQHKSCHGEWDESRNIVLDGGSVRR